MGILYSIKTVKNRITTAIDKVLQFILEKLFPSSNLKRLTILLAVIVVTAIAYTLVYQHKLKNLLPYAIKGKIVKAGFISSSGAGRTSGGTSRFFFKIEGYDAAFRMTNTLSLSHINGAMFKEGNFVEVGILKGDQEKLQVNDFQLTPIGMKVNGVEEVKVRQSLYNFIYMKYLYVSIPLMLYFIFSLLYIVLVDIFGKRHVKSNPRSIPLKQKRLKTK